MAGLHVFFKGTKEEGAPPTETCGSHGKDERDMADPGLV